MEGYFGDAVSSQCSECTCDVLGTDPEKYGFDGVYEKNACFIFSASLATERQGNAIVCPMLLEITALSARRITGRLQVERAVTPVLVIRLVTISWDFIKKIY